MITFAQIYEEFAKIKEDELRPGSLALMRGNWKSLRSRLENLHICEYGKVEAKMLQAELLAEGLAPKTVKDRMAFVKQLVRYANSNLALPTKSTEWNLRYELKEPAKLQLFQEAEMFRLIEKAYKELKDGNDNILPILISVLTGMRIGEVCGLKWGDIDLQRNLITVRRTVSRIYDCEAKCESVHIGSPKTRSGFRDIPLLPLLKDALREACPGPRNNDYYVVGYSSTPKAPHTVRDAYQRFLKRYKLPAINFHGLRHTYATRLVESRADVKTISTILGHADVTTTLNLYVHPSADAKRKAAVKAFSRTNKIRKMCEIENEKYYETDKIQSKDNRQRPLGVWQPD